MATKALNPLIYDIVKESMHTYVQRFISLLLLCIVYTES